MKGYGPDLDLDMDMDMDMAILFHPAVASESRRRGRDRLDGMGSKGPPPGSLSIKKHPVSEKAPALKLEPRRGRGGKPGAGAGCGW
ncbi:MAG: hypothetical protein E7197_07730 [Anaerovibrio sp.]|uniref:hypothetical protein n=1 Tax=Anaerovibrio sp. TaxID=1872532 RepID=UPI0025C2AADB|nr:hypothetical protein [Anaerovibrio sp.]MBE6099929.1 hypothetical protein [Anaerovibrio sp.]